MKNFGRITKKLSMKSFEINYSECTFFSPVGLSQSASLLGLQLLGFSLMELILAVDFTLWFLSSSQRSCRLPSPAHSAAISGRVAFTTLKVLFSRPTTYRTSLPTSLLLIGLFIPVPPGNPVSPPGVTH